MTSDIRNYIFRFAAGILIAASAAACSGVRNCQAPDLTIPESFSDAAATDSLTIADMDWAEVYSDPMLRSLIARALDRNRNLRSAEARVKRMEELYGVSRSNQLPSIDYTVGANHETNDYHGNQYKGDPEVDVKLALRWEIDFWGKLKWARRQASYDYLASVEARRAMEMTTIAQVADTYFRLVALDNELAIVRRTLTTRKESMDLARLRYEGGLTAETVYQQAKVEYASTAALVPNLEGRISQTENELALLVGEFPGHPLRRAKLDTEFYMPDSADIIVSSRLLQRRPDVRKAENELRSAMAAVGVTYADRFPTIGINITGGLENDEFATLLKSPFSYIAGTVTGPLLDMGRRRRRYKASLAAYDEARNSYEQTVLEVFGEAADAARNYAEARRTVRLRAELRDAASKYVELASLQYRGGSISYLDVLDAQRRYFDAQISLSNSFRDERLALVWLYRALGGGWSGNAK